MPTSAFTITTFGPTSQGDVLAAQVSQEIASNELVYQWQSSVDGQNWVSIAGATGSSMTLQQAQVGKQVRVIANLTVTSGGSGAVANVNDLPEGSVSVIGTVQEGQTLTATVALSDLDGLGTLQYQWQKSSNGTSWTDLVGHSQSTLNLTQADVGQFFRVRVDYLDGGNTAERVFSSATATAVTNLNQAPSGKLLVTGGSTTGSTLQVSAAELVDADGPGSVSFSWEASVNGVSWAAVPQAQGNQLSLDSLAGKVVRAVASYTDAFGTQEKVFSAASARVNDTPVGQIDVLGAATQGETMTASASLTDINGMGTVSWHWEQRTGAGVWNAIAGETKASLTLGQAQVGASVRAVASYTDAAGNLESVFAPASGTIANIDDVTTGAVVITGTAKDGQTLTISTAALTDADGLGSFTYQWQKQDAELVWHDIANANQATLRLQQADVGSKFRAIVAHTDAASYTSQLSTAAVTAANANDAPTGVLALSGPAGIPASVHRSKVGDVLSMDAAAIQDQDGLGAFSYSWQVLAQHGNWRDLAGQSAATLTLSSDVAGQKLRGVVKYQDAFGTQETVYSAASTPVMSTNWTNSAAVGSVYASGKAAVGQVLTAGGTAFDADWAGQLSYQWQVSKNGVSGWTNLAVGPSLSLASKDLGKYVRVVGSYTDELGSFETLIGSAAKVAKANVAPKFAAKGLDYRINEGVQSLMTPNATDVGDTISYSLAGDDRDFFEVSNGRVQFKAAPDFETRLDLDENNIYKFDLIATDSFGASSTQTVSVKIRDVNDNPEFLQYSRTIFVEQGKRSAGNLITDQAFDQDRSAVFMLAKSRTQILGDDVALFSRDSKANLQFKAAARLGEYSIRAIAYDFAGVSSEAQDITVQVVNKIVSSGTTANDYLVGTVDTDLIDGAEGDDKILGGAGEDIFDVSSGHDTIYDFGFGGVECLRVAEGASVTAYVTSDWTADGYSYNDGSAFMYSTGASIDLSAIEMGNGYTVEAISGHGKLIGSGLNDVISAGVEGNTLGGAGGEDTLIGNVGKDSFILDGNGSDTLQNFQSGSDKIIVQNLWEGVNAAASSASFVYGANLQAASTADQHLIYDTNSRELRFDADGSGEAEAVLIGTFTSNVPLRHTDVSFQWIEIPA